MPAQHNLNIPPYNDDWDPKSNFNRVMFRPGFPVQARELNQAQGILQDQIEQVASSLLKDGDVITPGEFYMTNPAPYIRVSSITNGSTPSEYVGYNLKGVQSGVKARVVHAEEATEDDDVTFYVVYEDGGTTSEFETFLEQETLESDTPQNYTAKVGVTAISKPVSSTAVGMGTLFTVTEGAYYVNGFVVRNEEQTITLSKYSTGPNFQVGFVITEEFVTSAEDSSLLDNSQGSSNFAAPGADRLKITLNLGKLLLGSKVPDFIMLARVENGSIIGQTSRGVKWDWLYDILAKRTFDESGNYIVSDFAIKPLEYYNAFDVDGVWDPDPDTGEFPPVPNSGTDTPLDFEAADALYSLRVDPGLAYVQGYEVGFSSPFYVYGNKPRSLNFIDSNFTKITEGYNISVTNVFGAPSLQNISEGTTVHAFDTLVLYRNFTDGYVGDARGLFPNGEFSQRPIHYGSEPIITVHIIASGPIGKLSLPIEEIIYNPEFSNSCVIETANPEQYTRGKPIGPDAVSITAVNVVTPRPSGVMKPRFFSNKELTGDNVQDSPYQGYNSVFKLGFLSSVYFTELPIISSQDTDTNTNGEELDWKIGYEVAGRKSQAVGVVERGSDGKVLIVSNIIGEFINGEYIEQQQGEGVKKTARIMREGEVVDLQFVDDGALTAAGSITVSALGLETVLTSPFDYLYIHDKNRIVLSTAGRDKLYNFPYTGGSSLNERVNYQLETSNGIKGYAITAPAKITNTLNKTKSVFSELSSLSSDKFSADISMRERSDVEVYKTASGSLFRGKQGENFLECEDFAGDASEELIANDIITFIDDEGNSVNKLVMFATKPIGYGRDRTKCRIYFTTTCEFDCTSKAVQRMRLKTFGGEMENLIYRLPVKTVATLQTDPKTTRINYVVNRQFTQGITNGGKSVTLTTTRENERFVLDASKASATILRGRTNPTSDTIGRFVRIESIDSDDGGRQITINLSEPVTDNVLLKINCQIRIINAQAKRKILKNKAMEIDPRIQSQPELISTNKLPSNRVISLGTADVLRVNSITQGAPDGDNDAVDISDNYIFDNGQRDNYYDIARLILKPGRPAILGTIFVNLDYFEHDDEGDFFSVDSYTHDEGISYGEIPTYVQGSSGVNSDRVTGRVIQLRDHVDFRPIVNTKDSVIASITDDVTAGFATNFKDTNFDGNAFAPRIPVANTEFQCDISYYLPRYDSLFLDKSGSLVLLEGNPSINPTPPADLSTAIRLYDLYLPAYTFSVKDIEIKKFNYRRYTMSDIAVLDRKLDNIQEVVSLTLLELSAINTGVRDAVTGLDRFKNGIVVDGFKDHSKGDVDALDYTNSIDPVRSQLRAGVFADQVELEEVNLTDNQRLADKYALNDGIVTVPYDDVDFLANPYATRSIKLHPFSSFSYHGNLKLYPEVDTFKDNFNRDDLVIENNSLYDALKAMPDSRVESGFSSIYGEWETSGRSQTSKLNVNGENLDKSLLKVGNVSQSSLKMKDQPNVLFNSETSSVKNTSFGDRVVDIQLGARMRSIPVHFSAGRLKPNTRYYAFFDDVDVSAWIAADAISTDYPDKKARVTTPSVDRKAFGEQLVTDGEGNISGIFIVPNGRAPANGSKYTTFGAVTYETSGNTRSFNIGQRVLRFTSSASNTLDKDSVNAYTDAVFTSGVVLNDKSETVMSTRLADNSLRTDDNDRSSRTITSTGVADIEVSVRGPERLARTVEVSKEYVTDTTGVFESEVVNQVQVVSNGQSDVEVRYDVSTEREIVTQQAPENVKYIEVEQRPKTKMQDPLAQSFLVDDTNPEGVFVTELDVAFETKDDDQAVMAYIVTTNGGVPTRTIVPHSKVVKNANTTLRVRCEIPGNRPSAVLKGGFVINGRQSGATGTVKADVLFETAANNSEVNVENHIYNVVVDNYEGEFIPGEIITSPNLIGERGVSAFIICEDEYQLTRVDLFDMGEGYDETTTVQFSEPELPGGRTATGVVKVAPNNAAPGQAGQVYDVIITDPGTGYVNVPLVYIVGPGHDAQSLCRTVPGRKAVNMGVATSIDGSIKTTFKFDAPVYLMGDTEYAFVVESPNTVDYKIYTSKLGETILTENARVTKQPNLGTLFKSQNGGVWTEDQTQDITFTLRRASFEVNTASKIKLNNAPLKSVMLRRDPIESISDDIEANSTIHGMNARVLKVYHDNHGLAPDDMVAIDGVVGDGLGDTFSGVPVTEINTLHKVLDTDLGSFTIMVSTPTTKSSVGGGAQVSCSYNRPYEVMNVCTGLMTFGTSLLGTTNRGTQAVGLAVTDVDSVTGAEKRFNQDFRYILDQPVPIKLMDTFYYDKPMQVANSINECHYNDGVHMGDQKSVETTIRMSTISTRVSPVIDLQRTNFTAARNLINNPKDLANILGPTQTIFSFGSAPAFVPAEAFVVDDYETSVHKIDSTGKNVLITTPPHKRFTQLARFDRQDLRDIGLTAVTTRASENFSSETRIMGSANAKWISKLFAFENPCDGITVKLTSVFYETDSIRVYFRPRTIGFDSDLSVSSWIPFNPQQSLPEEERKLGENNIILYPDQVGYYNPGSTILRTPGLPDSVELIKPRSSDTVNPDEIKADEWQSVTWSAQDLAKFDAIAIKIVMTANNPAYAPLIDDLQIIVSE